MKLLLVDKDGTDEGAAKAAEVNFLPAEIWRQRFLPGLQEFQGLSLDQIKFLETL